MFSEVVRFSPQLFMALGVTAGGESQRGGDLVSVTLKQERFRLVEPPLSSLRIGWIEQVCGGTQMVSGMVVVQGLLAIKKMKMG